WLNRVVTFGTESDAVRVRINRRIQRCVMVTIDPETAVKSPAVLRTVAQKRDNCVGVYASVEQIGTIRVGDVVRVKKEG
ncbi:MAG: MOSC domain-containing protein, partial [Chloroflexi bacterium]|nr:MOSC domain-containing protein [Chloroflexota bacterium]